MSTWRSAQTYKKCPFSCILNRVFNNLSQVFEQVKEQLLLEQRGMIRVPHLFLCPMDFNLLYDRGQQSLVLNPTKNDQFQVFLAVGVLSPKFLDRLRGGLSWSCTKS